MTLRAELADLVAALRVAHAGRGISLDELGEALGTRAVSADEVDEVIAALERGGCPVRSPVGRSAGEDLRRVLPAARALGAQLGRRPSPAEIAAHTGLDVDAVRAALALARVMGR